MSESTVSTPSDETAGERMKEAERERIARDLHDELGSRLTGIKMALAQLSPYLPMHDAALEWLAQNTAKQTGIVHRVLSQDDLPETLLDPFELASLYRIASEALHNAGRHAAARHINISLQYIGAQVVMEIVDEGVGLVATMEAAAARAQCSGIRCMPQSMAA